MSLMNILSIALITLILGAIVALFFGLRVAQANPWPLYERAPVVAGDLSKDNPTTRAGI